MFAVINTSNTDRNIGLVGTVSSLHRTLEAAEKVEASTHKAVKRANGLACYASISVVNLGASKKAKGANVYTDDCTPID